ARMTAPDLPYDRDGQVSAQGRVDEKVLDEMLADPWFHQPPPKSTGRERFGQGFAERLFERIAGPDAVATAVALTARSIAHAVATWVPGAPEVVASGGGVHHPLLWRSLEQALEVHRAGTVLRRFDDLFFDGDAKEAVAFALLGHLTLHGQPGNLPAATGAIGPRVLGAISGP
ncbi:MAG TPA: anhydro-N-acetylmuramic acid kinase, partial [Gemmatimonadales bacterium]|nr:anhydro-N-acetylmuramic acid kinase [Gemmatimonadales bacterium]